MFQQIMQQLTQGQGQGAPDTFDFTTEQPPPEGIRGGWLVPTLATLAVTEPTAPDTGYLNYGYINGTGGDHFDFKATEPTAPEAYMEYKLKNVMITSYQIGGAVEADTDEGSALGMMCDGSVRSDEGPEENDFSADVNGDTVTGTVTFGGSITLQNVREVDTLNDWFQI
jgi:hypothetical protein